MNKLDSLLEYCQGSVSIDINSHNEYNNSIDEHLSLNYGDRTFDKSIIDKIKKHDTLIELTFCLKYNMKGLNHTILNYKIDNALKIALEIAEEKSFEEMDNPNLLIVRAESKHMIIKDLIENIETEIKKSNNGELETKKYKAIEFSNIAYKYLKSEIEFHTDKAFDTKKYLGLPIILVENYENTPVPKHYKLLKK